MQIPDGWHKPKGVYGEDEESPEPVQIRPATSLERISLAEQPEFVYFVPFLPMAISPGFPDPASEFAYANNRQVKLVHWPLDFAMVPRLESRQFSTASIFGVDRELGEQLFNFAQGMVRLDPTSNIAAKLTVNYVNIVDPYASRARPAEKIVENRVQVAAFGLQLPQARYMLVEDVYGTVCKVVKKAIQEPSLWAITRKLTAGDQDLIQ